MANTSESYAARGATAVDLLLRAGARPRRPLIAVTKSAEALAVLAFAAQELQTPFFPLDPDLPGAVRATLLDQVGSGLRIGEGEALPVARVLSLEPGAPAPFAPTAGPALLIATSGSTGAPKIVTLTGRNLAASAAASATTTPLCRGDGWLACLPLFHIGGFSILSRCAFAGARLILHQGFDAPKVHDALIARRVTHLSLTPSMLALLLALDRPPPMSLRHVLVGGASLSVELAGTARERHWPVQPTYGMSETCSQLATLPRLPPDWRNGQVGRPLPGAEVALTPDGRLKVRGDMVMSGYANPDLSPGDGLDGGWFVSNDLAEISSAGDITILGRADDVIVSGGKKLVPAQIARELSACPGLGEFAVVGRPDPVWGEIVAVVYTGAIPAPALLDWARARLPHGFRPRAAVPVAVLPLLANGKPDRSALREIARGRQTEAGACGQA